MIICIASVRLFLGSSSVVRILRFLKTQVLLYYNNGFREVGFKKITAKTIRKGSPNRGNNLEGKEPKTAPKVMRKRVSNKYAQRAQKRVLRTPPEDLPEASRRRKSTPEGASEGTSTFPNNFFPGPGGLPERLGSSPEALPLLSWPLHAVCPLKKALYKGK